MVDLGPIGEAKVVAATMFGRLGPDIGGDQPAADLLKRTYTKLREVESDRPQLESSPYMMPLPQMTAVYNHWLSSLSWQAALVFADGVIALAEGPLRREVYALADALCDEAAARTRRTKTDKPVLAQPAVIAQLPNNSMTYLGVWNLCNEIVDQINDDLTKITQLGIPARMNAIHDGTTRVIQLNTTAVKALQADWKSTTMADNRMQLTQELFKYTTEIFKAGQQLWAPYMAGQRYKDAIQKEKTLDELDLGFDPWILTDPRRKEHAQEKELIGFWESVTNRDTAPILAAEISDALRSGAIRRRTNHGYTNVPWQSQFLVIRPITLGGTALEPRQLCAYYPGHTGIEIRRAGTVRNILELLGSAEER